MNISLISISKLGELLLAGQHPESQNIAIVYLSGNVETNSLNDIIRKIIQEELMSLKTDKLL